MDVIDKPKELCGNSVPTVLVLIHAINSLKHKYDVIVFLLLTPPLRTDPKR